MKNKFTAIAVLTLAISLICLFYADITPAFAKEKREKVAVLTIQQLRWTKSSFRKAEKRLAKVNIGMTENEFLNTMKWQMFQSDGKVITGAMDGFIIQLGENVTNEKVGRIQTYVFGYVDAQNILHEKYFVVVKDNKIIEKIRLDDYKWDEKFYLDTRSSPTKDDYKRALEYVKNIKPGMWSGEVRRLMHMVGVWSGTNVNLGEVIQSAEGEFFIFGPGYLRDRYSQKEAEEGLIQQFVFGYEENGNVIPCFLIHLNNLQVTKIEYLQTR